MRKPILGANGGYFVALCREGVSLCSLWALLGNIQCGMHIKPQPCKMFMDLVSIWKIDPIFQLRGNDRKTCEAVMSGCAVQVLSPHLYNDDHIESSAMCQAEYWGCLLEALALIEHPDKCHQSVIYYRRVMRKIISEPHFCPIVHCIH